MGNLHIRETDRRVVQRPTEGRTVVVDRTDREELPEGNSTFLRDNVVLEEGTLVTNVRLSCDE